MPDSEIDSGPVDPFEASEPAAASQRLRAFEDEHLGEGAPRISGKLERGHGSLFSRLPIERQKEHAAIEKTVATEQKLADAHTALLKAEADHNAALDDASRFGG
jgi:hypothetical protein